MHRYITIDEGIDYDEIKSGGQTANIISVEQKQHKKQSNNQWRLLTKKRFHKTIFALGSLGHTDLSELLCFV